MRARLLAGCALAALAFACGPSSPGSATAVAAMSGSSIGPGNAGGVAPNRVTVMTQNLYIGGAVEPFFAPGVHLSEIPAMAGVLWSSVQATDFPARAERIADEIADARPALVGLQEAALWRTQFPGDNVPGGNNNPATEVAYDFLEILRSALAARGLSYDVAVVHQNIDVEAFALPQFMDVRLTDRDAILVRSDVRVLSTAKNTYAAAIHLPLGQPGEGGPTVDVVRGWTMVEAEQDGVAFMFVNTHLEPFSSIVQDYQAMELVATFAGATEPLILVGDFNAGPGSNAYGMFQQAGYRDAWSVLYPKQAGLTCCQDGSLMNAQSLLDDRVDLVQLAGHLTPKAAAVVGASPADRTASGLWPSDHAGVVAKIVLDDARALEPVTAR